MFVDYSDLSGADRGGRAPMNFQNMTFSISDSVVSENSISSMGRGHCLFYLPSWLSLLLQSSVWLHCFVGW